MLPSVGDKNLLLLRVLLSPSSLVCLCICTVMDFSAEDKAGSVKFCTAVHRRPRHTFFCELYSTRSPKSDESATRGPRPPACKQTVEMLRRKRHARDAPFVKSSGV